MISLEASGALSTERSPAATFTSNDFLTILALGISKGFPLRARVSCLVEKSPDFGSEL